jgi:hypothetical protein
MIILVRFVASGARTSGYAMFVQNDRLAFTYNRLNDYFDVRSDTPLPDGEMDLIVRYRKSDEHVGVAQLLVVPSADDGSGSGSGEEVVLGSGPVETLPYRQTTYGMDIGQDAGPTISPAYVGPFPFAGTLRWVDFVLEDDRDDLRKAAEQELENQLADQ